MDFQRFRIDPRLLDAAKGLRSQAFFHEKMLTHVLEAKENVCAKIVMSEGREEIYLFPVMQVLASSSAEEQKKALIVIPDSKVASSVLEFCSSIGGAVGLHTCLVTGSLSAEGFAAASPILEGDPAAELVIGEPKALLDAFEAGMIRLRDYAWLVADGLERLAELPGDILRKLQAELLPSWERRSILVCEKLTVKAKNLAWDLADNPSEIRVEEEVAKAQSVVRETWQVAIKDKPRFLLGLIEREKPRRICVFCNLGSTAEELARRLDVNGLRSECIADSQTTGRAGPLQEKRKSEDFYALVLTDEGAQSVSSDPTRGLFSLVVNYDIPLEPDFFVKRLEMLDRADASAKVVSMVCDRYVYGLTAVEHYIEAKLDARPIDPSLLAARDLSEGMVFGRSRDIDRRRHGESRGFASGHSRDASTRDDRSPEIRRSIAEATGGSIDMGGNAIKQPVVRQAARQKSRGTALSGRGTEGRRGGKAKEPIVPENGRSVRRPPTGEAVANPYDLPMEERMRRYREKYGRHIEGKNAEKPRSAPGRDEKGSNGRAKARSEGPSAGDSNAANLRGKRRKNGQTEIQREQRSPRAANRAQPSQNRSHPETHGTISSVPGGIAPLKKPTSSGLLGKIKGIFRGRS